MKISGSIIIEKKKDNDEGPKRFIEFSFNGTLQERVPYSDFQDIFSTTTEESVVALGIGKSILVTDETKTNVPDGTPLKRALDFLLANKLPEGKEFLTEDSELVIESDSPLFLRLPWERFINLKQTAVFRQVPNGTPSTRQENAAKNHAKFLILRSHAYILGNTDIGELGDRPKLEINSMVDQLMDKFQVPFRVGHISIIKHATKVEMSGVDFGLFHYVHMIMHGGANGELYLEDANRPEHIDALTRDDFITLLKGKAVDGRMLFFLSFCHSGGGDIFETNLSFELVNRGIAEYAVGYDGTVRNDVAEEFAVLFYGYIAAGKSIKESFVEANRSRKQTKYTPLLYGRFLEKTTSI